MRFNDVIPFPHAIKHSQFYHILAERFMWCSLKRLKFTYQSLKGGFALYQFWHDLTYHTFYNTTY